MNTCTRVTVWHVAFHRPGPPVVLASTRDTLPRGIPYVYAPRLFNGGRSVALKRYKKTSPPPNPGKPHRVFSPDSPTGYFMGRCANYPGRNSIVSFVTRIPNFRTFVYDSIFGQAACARVWVGDARHDGSGRE